MYADFSHAKVRGIPLIEAIPDRELWEKTLPSQVERRGWVLMELRGGVSSVLSVARASVDVARDWCLGTQVGGNVEIGGRGNALRWRCAAMGTATGSKKG